MTDVYKLMSCTERTYMQLLSSYLTHSNVNYNNDDDDNNGDDNYDDDDKVK